MTKPGDVKEIVKLWLEQNGYDGLCEEDCGCFLGEFMPCDTPLPSCEPAYQHRSEGEGGYIMRPYRLEDLLG